MYFFNTFLFYIEYIIFNYDKIKFANIFQWISIIPKNYILLLYFIYIITLTILIEFQMNIYNSKSSILKVLNIEIFANISRIDHIFTSTDFNSTPI